MGSTLNRFHLSLRHNILFMHKSILIKFWSNVTLPASVTKTNVPGGFSDPGYGPRHIFTLIGTNPQLNQSQPKRCSHLLSAKYLALCWPTFKSLVRKNGKQQLVLSLEHNTVVEDQDWKYIVGMVGFGSGPQFQYVSAADVVFLCG